MAIYTPKLSGRAGPKYRQIVDAITDDISAGTLAPGTRLPPHRILAYELGISPNTTARAYAECTERGLLHGEVGRGTYVRLARPPAAGKDLADLSRPGSGPIDLSRNLPFPGVSGRYLSRTLAELSGAPELSAFLDHQSEKGLVHHLHGGCDWLARTGVKADPDEIVITCGAQHGTLVTLMAVTRPGDLLLTESLTYAPVCAIAQSLGLRVHPVAMDGDGLLPKSLETVCRSRKARALYLTPTLQTPTTVTLDEDRRQALVQIAEKHNLIIIEDDVYGLLRPEGPTRLSALAPDRTIYISSCSKGLAPGLRVAFLRAPKDLMPALRRAVTLSCWMPPPLMVEVACRWIADGTADELIQDQQVEATQRQAMAKTILAGQAMAADRQGFHIWLTLPSAWRTEGFCSAAQSQGVLVTDGSAFAVGGRTQPNAVRISLGCEPSRKRVEQGLKLLAGLLTSPGAERPLVI
ncbi:transcriptional regulator [Desulfosarcina ovata subsp. sediminis]|uniref:Transcriptional regulator n=1 Tax=Desulfosarcina ovata subsp. sediminis TaxID=885957 RepID=A0A5K7ZXJ1_9BACT|nr:PLP-dependent aminotransferase family protein [Desulfosarcina ovata]BBO84977.1 transcriptional regulator [Desulfosarcina ovata subsp. sediminis]